MKYEGYKIGPVIRDIRKDKGLLIEEVAAKTVQMRTCVILLLDITMWFMKKIF